MPYADLVTKPATTCVYFIAVAMVSCQAPASQPMFHDVASEVGLGAFRHQNGAQGDFWFPEIMGSGAAFTDFNNDGAPDLALVRGGTFKNDPVPALALYANDGSGYFTDVTNAWGLDNVVAYGMGIVAGDIDNDGDQDIYITTTEDNILLRNDGGVFRDGTAAAGLDGPPGWDVAAVFFDADRDGWLDLFVGSYVNWTPETDMFCTSDGTTKGYCTPHLYEAGSGRLYRNHGDGTFSDQAGGAGLAITGKTLGAMALDINRDGWPDLAVANDSDPDRLYLNQGDGTFVDEGLFMGMALDGRGRARAGMGIKAGVVDSSGFVTLFVGNFSKEVTGVFRLNATGRFEERSVASGIGAASFHALTFGLLLTDVDLNGHLDLLAVNGHVHPRVEERSDAETFRQHPQLFVNDGQGHFVEQGRDLGFTRPLVGRGAAAADIDADGDEDLLITENDGPVRLYRNDGVPKGTWLRLQLVGMESNRSAIGAHVMVTAAGRRQYRTIHAGSSYASQSELTATFGLGTVQMVDTIVVYWPSGHVQRRVRVEAAQTLRLVEGDR